MPVHSGARILTKVIPGSERTEITPRNSWRARLCKDSQHSTRNEISRVGQAGGARWPSSEVSRRRDLGQPSDSAF